MKGIIIVIFIMIPLFSFSQTIEVEEQSISVCYMGDKKRSDIVSVTKAEAELDSLKIEAHFDCNFPVSDACGDYSLGKYIRNSIDINGETIKLGGQLNGDNIVQFNVGRFFLAEDDYRKFIIFEMANTYCPNVPNSYCYIIVSLNDKNKIEKHILYNKENNPIMEEGLSRVIEGFIKSEDNNVEKKAI